jgi:hypothetical protein
MEEFDMAPPRTASPALALTIRFSSSLPDLPLTVPSPSSTTTAAIKRQLRSLRPADTAKRRLRLIYSGKELTDGAVLSESLKLSPQRSISDPKGKSSAVDQVHRYLICSIGEELSDAELAQEARHELLTATSTSHQPRPSTAPQPLGFDRLLSAGFSPAEVAGLREQFLRLQSHTHTPDAMPTPAEMRLLEDRWIDDTTGPGPQGLGGGSGTGDATDGVGTGAYEDMLLGTVMGFFWPVGAVVWLLREEGVWSKRRQMAVVAGMLVNIAFSVLRVTS